MNEITLVRWTLYGVLGVMCGAFGLTFWQNVAVSAVAAIICALAFSEGEGRR